MTSTIRDVNVDRDAPVQLREQVAAEIRRAIAEGQAKSGERLPAMVTPRWVSTRTQPVALPDVVAYLAGVCGLEAAFGAAFDVGGPEVMTYREMIERIARLRDKHPFIFEVPVLTPYLSSLWLHVVTPVKAAVARPLIEGLRTETVVR